MIVEAGGYVALPLALSDVGTNPAQAEKGRRLVDAMIRHESFFTDYERACEAHCGKCEKCLLAGTLAISALSDPKSMCWEVWSRDPESGLLLDFAGILRLSNVRRGCYADAHYFFFDGRLPDKTPLLEAWRSWAFSDASDWKALERVTTEIPVFAFALARHAVKRLGFGGPFTYSHKGTILPVEGVKRHAVRWHGEWWDVLVMGALRG